MVFQNPTSDQEMTYDIANHRYVLTEQYVKDMGIDLGLILDTAALPNPADGPRLLLERVSRLVYSNIYNYGRQKAVKEYMLACGDKLRPIIRDAMFERLNYITSSGDLSTKSGAIITNGSRIDVKDLAASVVEEMMLRAAGLLHRGEYSVQINTSLVY